MEPYDYRLRARENLSGNWLLAALVTLIAILLGGASTSSGSISIDQDDMELIKNIPWLMAIMKPLLTYAAITGFIGFIVGGVVHLGYCTFHLNLYDHTPATVGDLFSHFRENFAGGFLLRLLTAIYIFLWSLLLFVPGIIKTYSYAMAPFIMAEHPEMNANECITMSKEIMHGHKMELFFLELSFIGWIFLAIFTLGIGNVFLTPYITAARAAFYRDIMD